MLLERVLSIRQKTTPVRAWMNGLLAQDFAPASEILQVKIPRLLSRGASYIKFFFLEFLQGDSEARESSLKILRAKRQRGVDPPLILKRL
jgi:hypothetical protein